MAKTYKYLLLAGLLVSLVGAGVRLYQKREQKAAVANALQHAMPDVRGTSVTGQDFTLRSLPVSPFTLIIFFNPFCDHCDYEAAQLQAHMRDFAQGRVLMVSDDKLENIRAFQARHHLTAIPNVEFLHMDANRVFATFGSVSVPQLYLYSQQGKLVRMVKGEVNMAQVVQWL